MKNRTRLVLLVGQIGRKISGVENKGKVAQEAKEKMLTLGRLLQAYASGRYQQLGWRPLVTIAAAVLYFINPADIVPDIIPVSGLVDDLSILVWTYQSLQIEIDKFLTWEKSNLSQ